MGNLDQENDVGFQLSRLEAKQAWHLAVQSCFLLFISVVLVVMVIIVFHSAREIDEKLSDIREGVDMLHPRNPQFNVIHGWYPMKNHPKGGEFRMLRATDKGYLICGSPKKLGVLQEGPKNSSSGSIVPATSSGPTTDSGEAGKK